MIAGLIPLSMLGGAMGLDTVSFPQAMLSRPLVAATAGGALAGSPTAGLIVGAALELIALETLPVGASRYPEWGSASVVGGALFARAPGYPAGAMTLALIAAVATAWVGGWTMVRLRELNGRWATRSRAALDAGSRQAVIGLQIKGLTADLLRGVALTFVALVTFTPLADASLALWSVDARLSRAVAVGVSAAVAGAAVWKVFHGSALARWLFALGLGAGAVMTVRA